MILAVISFPSVGDFIFELICAMTLVCPAGLRLMSFAVAVFMLCIILQPRKEFINALPAGVDWRNADVLLLGSSTWRGHFLRLIDGNSSFLHVGIIDNSDGVVHMIHADPARGFVVRDRLDDYFKSNKVDCARLLRVDGGEHCAVVAVEYARRQLDARRCFDDSFRYGEGEGFYCTELVLRAWNAAGVELLPDVRTGDKVLPSRLLDSSILHTCADFHGVETATSSNICCLQDEMFSY